ncbi:hypothetical protein [Agilicoccus flavus]|uniref:hypothetical protein n=1 Tax=Agilicoccus flavus TaxID=2775968 RepID=UPI001CF6C56F|nr:hypothetical protein [Agilicoccus flavus]
MSCSIVDAAVVPAGHGPHPAAGPYDKRLGEYLGLTAFEAYQVELPAHAETVEHDHLDDDTEDMYAVLRGGWLVVDGQEVPVRPGQFLAVSQPSRRLMRAGADDMDFIAVCASAARTGS